MKFFVFPTAADWRRPSVIALLLANLVPVFGVVALHWEVFPLLFLFWSENVIVGAVNVLKMIFAGGGGVAGQVTKFFLIPFFCVHYGMFTFIHGVFVLALFGGDMMRTVGFPSPATFWRVMHENHLGWAVLGLAVSRGISFVTNFLGKGEYKNVIAPVLMFQPYGRIVVLHVAILGGGFLLMALHSPVAGLLVLVALKTALDLGGHLRERETFSGGSETVKTD